MAVSNNAANIFRSEASRLLPRIPVSTYRLQLGQAFTFFDAAEIIEYLHELGITDIYTSPYFMAAENSEHGYDITDPGQISPEVGGEEGFRKLCDEMAKRDMGLIADIVPNHMGIDSPRNSWWLDLMENGPSSPYAKYFDIDWKPVRTALSDKVIIPVLGDQYGRVLENGEIKLTYCDEAFYINYYDHRFPVDPSTYEMVLTYRLEDLDAALSQDSPDYQEAMSILTALRHLPTRLETSAPKATERMREKEVIKRRIAALYDSCPAYRKHLKLNLSHYNGIAGKPESYDLLHCLLDAQVYRLSFWQVSTEEINYRRFFDINSLAAIRTEDPEVFESAHALVLRHIAEGKVTGLRIDHPDGLYNPGDYFRRLQTECALNVISGRLAARDIEIKKDELNALWAEHSAQTPKRPFYLVGEKILIEDEAIPMDWQVYGTTGYAFMNSVGGLFVEPRNMAQITSTYNLFVSSKPSFARTLYESKKLIMNSFMSSEINVLGNRLDTISESRRHTRDFTLNSLTDAIVEVIACFPVYRTYITGNTIDERDIRYIKQATSRAKRLGREISPLVLDFIQDVLTLNIPENMETELRNIWLEFAMKFQQLTGPIMAKGFEDTSFYCYNRLVSLNEVGGNPESFGIQTRTFHELNARIQTHWPHTLNASSTHDSKRSEDARVRISVISELAGQWREATRQWKKINRKFKTRLQGLLAPDQNDEYMLYQNLLGIWPIQENAEDDNVALREDITSRMQAYMIKASREAKTHTSWLNINAEYEEAITRFVHAILNSGDFMDSFRTIATMAGWYGMFNSLSQTLLKIASPGVPDFYQGTELLNLRLVDPDNRLPVDYTHARKSLSRLKRAEHKGLAELARSLCNTLSDGQAKLFLTYKALNYRRQRSSLFKSGHYLPIECDGPDARHIVSFQRSDSTHSTITVVPRLLSGRVKYGQLPLDETWDGTWLMLPANGAFSRYKNVFTDEEVEAVAHGTRMALALPEVLKNFPVALLEGCG